MRFCLSVFCLGLSFVAPTLLSAEPLTLHMRSRTEVAPDSGRYHAVTQPVEWNPKETAIVVCDMWDTHTCPNAALRVSQMAPRMNEVLKAARAKGIFIIHSPSGTMKFYEEHPGRQLAMSAPMTEPIKPLQTWCKIDPEHEDPLPIDDTDGGCDCERTWKPGDPYPWTRQIATIEIMDGDAITDSAEAYYLLKQRGIKNLIVMGVHTNMCVLGRPFSIRQMVYQDLNVALMRDMTDTMYNPEMKPFVSHFTGTDLVVEHIEKFWCPTLISGDFLDGHEYRFPADTRPHVVIVQGESEYKTAETLPKFALDHLGKDYRVSFVWLDEKSNASFPGIETVKDADVLFISARRRPIPPEQMAILKAHVAAGKPVIGIRTASHAFHLRNQPAPAGLADWPDIDATVFGGSYTNHYAHDKQSTIWPLPERKDHPILAGIPSAEFPGGGGLYQTAPLKEGAVELLRGKVEGVEQPEPVAWTFTRQDGGKSFYTSLGHIDDFQRAEFTTLLKNAIAWASGGRQPPERTPKATDKSVSLNDTANKIEVKQTASNTSGTRTQGADAPRSLVVPGTWNDQSPALKDYDGYAWYRANVTIPAEWAKRSMYLYVEKVDNACETFFNGVKIGVSGKLPPEYESGLIGNEHRYVVPPELVKTDGPNLVAIRVYDHDGNAGFKGMAPHLLAGNEAISLAGTWDFHVGDDLTLASTPLAKFEAFAKIGPAPQLSRFATVIRRQAQDKPLSPQQSRDLFKIPDDLEVDIVLTEPTISQPVFLNFDERGRIWVLNYLQYPEPAGLKLLSKDQWWRAVYDKVPLPPPHGDKGADKITIHEDTDGDGTFDSHKTFVDGLNIATAFAQGRGGVFVLNPPYLLFYPDKNQDDVPDSDPEVLLEGFGIEDTHSTINSLRWGPDGWLYAAQGSTVSGAVRRPGEKAVVHSQGQNIWRYHPELKKYEIFAEGGGNAFSVEIDSQGRIFSGHNGGNTRGFHYMQGAYLQKGFGKHGPLSNPFAFGYFPAMEHGDYARFTHNFIIYESDALPEKYHGVIFGVNPINSHVVLSERIPVGSTFKTRDIGFAIDSSDTWFRPVDIKDGPDGNIYVADWYDGQLAHTANYQGGMDRDHGRIYRIRSRNVSRDPQGSAAAKARPALTTLFASTRADDIPHSNEIAKYLTSPNRWERQTALRVLADRREEPAEAWIPISEHERDSNGEWKDQEFLDGIWAVFLTSDVDEKSALDNLTLGPQTRLWTIQLLANTQKLSPEFSKAVIELAKVEPDIHVLCQLASSAKRLPPAQSLPITHNLMTRSQFIDDPRFPLLVWWALEANVEPARNEVLAMFQDEKLWREPLVEKEILPRLMRRFAATGQRADLAVCTQLLKFSPTKETTAALMRGFEEAYQGRSLNNVPAELVEALSKAGGGSLSLKIRQGDREATAEALKVLADEKASSGKRVEYANLFGEVTSPSALPVMLEVLAKTSDDNVRSTILGSLPSYNDEDVPVTVLKLYSQWTDDVRSVAQSLLVSRKPWAKAFLDAIARGDIQPSSIPVETVRKLTIYGDTDIAATVKSLWGEVDGASTAEMQAEQLRLTAALNDGGGNPYPGKKLYMQSCGKCHVLHAQGGQIGPDLTTFKRDDVPRLLINILNPSAEIREGYETHVAILDDGRVVQGFLVEQDPQVIVLRTSEGQTVSIEREGIEEHVVMKKSLMPEGQLKALSDQDVRDLFAYLRSTQPLSD
ncbi:c-type cytochrome [bacterium]|nr:c-type cytochrome [bacterium]